MSYIGNDVELFHKKHSCIRAHLMFLSFLQELGLRKVIVPEKYAEYYKKYGTT